VPLTGRAEGEKLVDADDLVVAVHERAYVMG
jgi:hypothetical protein